ncbi:MAG: hypothetical protein FD174_1494 [Geobacteraceae bacterium]|nr:MAG: hypothetical protein FD174_1494 [Geobacteraceae bacterium]
MLILVVYDDGTHDMVEAYQLDYLINTGRIVEFCRSSGWVKIGKDPIRGPEKEHFGPERRMGVRDFRLPPCRAEANSAYD